MTLQALIGPAVMLKERFEQELDELRQESDSGLPGSGAQAGHDRSGNREAMEGVRAGGDWQEQWEP